MDPLTFASLVVKAIAWPATLGTSTYVLREPIKGLISRIGSLKMGAGGFEVDFGEQLSETARAFKAGTARPGAKDETAKAAAAAAPVSDALLRLASTSPKAAVIQAWELVEVAAQRAAARVGIEVDAELAKKPLELAEKLLDAKVVDETDHEVFRRLRLLRNQAKHWDEMKLSVEDAVDYCELAARLESFFDQVKADVAAKRGGAKSSKSRASARK